MDFTTFDDPKGINQALFDVTHGLYILTSKLGDKINGQCLDAMMQTTNNPPRVAIGVGKRSLTHDMIMETGKFIVNAIDKDDHLWFDKVKLFGFKSGRNIEKFKEFTDFTLSEYGIPILNNAKAFYECEVVKEMCVDLVTHTLFTGFVTKAGNHEGGDPLTYNEYRKISANRRKDG